MKAIMVMFDSLNRRLLPPYGCDWTHAPNFERLAEKSVTFDNSYVGSLPCMPARREIHTGRYNFLHRSWGPIEPFDDCMPEILHQNGIYTHIVSDHYHYWEDGGCTYHTRYKTWEIARGHEGDPWKGEVKDPEIPEHVPNSREGGPHWRQDWVNRKYMQKEEELPQAKTFSKGMEFIRKNHEEDNWFLHIETFDPHEPFYTVQKYKDLYKDEYKGPHFDWPDYNIVRETPEEIQHVRFEYAASLGTCDEYLGKILDMMDELDLWKDTMLIINTDHGFLLGEKDWWGKAVQPVYNELANTPLFIWDPRSEKQNERRKSLVQTIDLAPTLLDFFGVKIPDSMQGKELSKAINSDEPVREAGLFGFHGGFINMVTQDGYIYMRCPNPLNEPLYNYTLMPTHMRGFFQPRELQTVELANPFPFTKGCKTMKIDVNRIQINNYVYGTSLYNLNTDPMQENPLFDVDLEKKMIKIMIQLMMDNNCPEEQFERLELPYNRQIEEKHLKTNEKRHLSKDIIADYPITWLNKGKSMYYAMLRILPPHTKKGYILEFEKTMIDMNIQELDEEKVEEIFKKIMPAPFHRIFQWLNPIIKKKSV